MLKERTGVGNGATEMPVTAENDAGGAVRCEPTYRHRSPIPALVKFGSFFLLVFLIGPEVAVTDSSVTRQLVQIEHVKIETAKKFAEAEAALERIVPQLNPAIRAALAEGNEQRVKELEGGEKLFIFLKRDHGVILQIAGRPAKALQYEIGNPFTATRMTRHQLAAALYAPLRVVLYENAAGTATFEYDRPSTLVGQFDDEAVTAVGRELDAELESALRHAAE
jgi:Domain of unknown function DUF302